MLNMVSVSDLEKITVGMTKAKVVGPREQKDNSREYG
jgi:hypothetical protein